MKTKMRCVFDTNILISALLFPNSKPDRAVRYGLENGSVLISLEMLEELNEVLGRKKFDRYLTIEEREEFLATFVERTVLIEIVVNVQACRDPKDDKVLDLTLNGDADYIITGDRDLLVLHPFCGVQIVTVENFLKIE